MTETSEISWCVKGPEALKLKSCEMKCDKKNILLMGPSIWRSFSGATSPTFENSHMKLTAPLGPYMLPFWIVVGVIQIVGVVASLNGEPGLTFSGLAAAGAALAYKTLLTNKYTLLLVPSDIASVKRNGPFFEIYLTKPIFLGFSKVKFYVSEGYRDKFVKDVSNIFSGTFDFN